MPSIRNPAPGLFVGEVYAVVAAFRQNASLMRVRPHSGEMRLPLCHLSAWRRRALVGAFFQLNLAAKPAGEQACWWPSLVRAT